MVIMASGGHIFLLKVSRHFNSLQADGFVRWFNLCNGARLTKSFALRNSVKVSIRKKSSPLMSETEVESRRSGTNKRE